MTDMIKFGALRDPIMMKEIYKTAVLFRSLYEITHTNILAAKEFCNDRLNSRMF